MYHFRGGLTVGQVNRFTIEIDSDQLGSLIEADELTVRIKNTTSALMRPAYLAGPYILYVSIREDSYRPDRVLAEGDFSPHFDANLKTNCSRWQTLPVKNLGSNDKARCKQYVVDVISQVIFSPSAKVYYELTIGLNKKQVRLSAKNGKQVDASIPGFNVDMVDTEKLWDMPPIPRDRVGHHIPKDLPVESTHSIRGEINGETYDHLVVLTHGIHSNLTSDMLYTKEVIEAKAKEAGQRVICKGFAGNTCNTERGVKWLGKRLAEWVLRETGWICDESSARRNTNPYKKISFIAHSLGGLVQVYAMGYIHDKTFGRFLCSDIGLEPINFITLATPWLGISAENPGYVKLALDFGLVGKTGQDLALTVKPLGEYTVRDPKNLGDSNPKSPKNTVQGTKVRNAAPLLKILSAPNSPCHQAISMFRNRTVYANIENDGIVPLRTSSLYFLDWESFRQDQESRSQASGEDTQVIDHEAAAFGISEAMADQLSLELRGSARFSSERASSFHGPREASDETSADDSDDDKVVSKKLDDPKIASPATSTGHSPENSTAAETPSKQASFKSVAQAITSLVGVHRDVKHGDAHQQDTSTEGKATGPSDKVEDTSHNNAGLISLLWPGQTHKGPSKSFSRTQTIKDSIHSHNAPIEEPSRTSFFKSLESVLNPPMPDLDSLRDPSLRDPPDQVIVHDQLYRPSDIPPLRELPRKPTGLHKTEEKERVKLEKIKLEEKIARGWHDGMTWRKVLVKLRPDAHNNIVVRRMFANSYGWPVIDHLAQHHFTTPDVKGSDARQIDQEWDRTMFRDEASDEDKEL